LPDLHISRVLLYAKLPAAAAMIYARVTTRRVTSSKMRVTWYIGGQQIRLPLAGRPLGRRDRAAYNTFLSIVERIPFVGIGTTLFHLEIVIDYRNRSICGASSLWRIDDKRTSACHYYSARWFWPARLLHYDDVLMAIVPRCRLAAGIVSRKAVVSERVLRLGLPRSDGGGDKFNSEICAV